MSQIAEAEERAKAAEQATCALLDQHRKQLENQRQAHAFELSSLVAQHQKVGTVLVSRSVPLPHLSTPPPRAGRVGILEIG